jgi:hypothetical protein
MDTEIKNGSKVRRMGIFKDYTTGREGTVIEMTRERARVFWSKDRDGGKIASRTWVNKRFLLVIGEPDQFSVPDIIGRK